MLPTAHFLLAFLISILCINSGFLNIYDPILIALLAVLIDIDHYISYILKSRDFSIRNAWNSALSAHHYEERTFIHHFSGFIIITILLTVILFFSRHFFMVLAIAYYSHFLLDHINLNLIKTDNNSMKFTLFGFSIKLTPGELFFNIACLVIIILFFLIGKKI